MASILNFQLRDRPQDEVIDRAKGRIVAMKHVDLEVVTDLMRLFRKMEDPEYRKAYEEAKGVSTSMAAESISCTEKD